MKIRHFFGFLCLLLLVGCRQLEMISSKSSPLKSNSKISAESKPDIATDTAMSQERNFVLPSGNIYCALVGENDSSLRCEIASLLNPMPPQSESNPCNFDWGAGFLLKQDGKPEILCISDTIAGSDNTLNYGQTWSNEGFTCESEAIGLKCLNKEGHGFFLSRDKWETF
jgi:hypothetical protein